MVTKSFQQEGLNILTSHKALRIEMGAHGPHLIYENSEKEVTIAFDQILLALGRKANVSGFGLEELCILNSASEDTVTGKNGDLGFL